MKIIQKTLSNGLRIVMAPQPDAATATVLILVGTGSKYETKKENGLSHFLEHMYFKGTELRPTARIIAETLDNMGAVSNAFTSHEYTGYYAKGNPSHVKAFIDVLSDIYLHSTFPEKEIEKEKGVIIEEINMYDDMPQRKVWDRLFVLMYGDQPAAWPISGSKEDVRSFTRKDFINYEKNHYTAGNTIVTVAGAFDPKEIQTCIKVAFAAISSTGARSKKKVSDKQIAPQSTFFHKKIDQAHIALAFRSVPYNHPDAAAVSLLATILGGGMSSQLFLLLREELGAAYYVSAEHDPYTDHGIFSITAGIDKSRYTEVVQRIIEVLKGIKTTIISPEELHKVKEFTLGMMRLGLESSDSIAGFYGSQVLLKNSYRTPEQLTKEYMAVTAQDIQRVAKKLFVSNHANISVVGPFEKGFITSDILKNM
jgi:predicted Zn-dependent peptidase